MSQEKGTDNLYKRPGYIFILSLPLIRGARHSLRIKSFYFTAANIRTISLTSKQIPHFFFIAESNSKCNITKLI